MKRFLCVLLLLAPTCAFASHKDPANYVDGVLVSIHEIRSAPVCSNVGDTDASCFEGSTRLYTVQIAAQVMTLRRARVGFHESVLANKLPGTHFETFNDGSHIRVRIGKKESIYDIVEAH